MRNIIIVTILTAIMAISLAANVGAQDDLVAHPACGAGEGLLRNDRGAENPCKPTEVAGISVEPIKAYASCGMGEGLVRNDHGAENPCLWDR